MAIKFRFENGPRLEARVQRLFMCQGAYAERGLFMRAGPGDAKMVTDVDVVAHDYTINFSHRRTYAECKGGKNKSALDRVVWIRGMKEVIAADSAYLVLDHCDPSTVRFARSQSVDILQASSLETLEDSLRISPDFWPGRCNLHAFGPIENIFSKLPSRAAPESVESWLKNAQEVWRESSALTFSYGRLNALLGMLQECKDLAANKSLWASGLGIAIEYAVSSLFVRLAQYMLFVASDTLAMTHSERVDYLSDRLVSGSLDIGQSRQILNGALHMVNSQLAVAGLKAPASWNIDSMLSPPRYTHPFAEAVARIIAEGSKATMLPLAMELRMFGYSGEEYNGATLLNRARYAYDTTGLVVALARQSLDVPETMTRGIVSHIEGLGQLGTKEREVERSARTARPQEQAVTETSARVEGEIEAAIEAGASSEAPKSDEKAGKKQLESE